MKWIILILGIGLLRGIIFPDYRFAPNIANVRSSYLFNSKKAPQMAWLKCSGLVSVYLSTIVGIIVYGVSAGWQCVINDSESQAVFMATAGIQTITYLTGLGLFALAVKRYNKASKQGVE